MRLYSNGGGKIVQFDERKKPPPELDPPKAAMPNE